MGPEATATLSPEEAQALLRRVARGDRQAFGALYEGFHRPVFRYLFRLVRDQEMAEGLLNDVMFEVWKGAGRFEGRSKPSTWILGIARHLALNALRRQRPATVEADEAVLRDDRLPPLRAAELAQLRGSLRRALARLSPEHRSVVELTYAHGLSCQEIAEVMDCPVNTVKTRMFYARQRLREVLQAMGVEP